VEVQALWVNVLSLGALWSKPWGDTADRARESFRARFWNPDLGCLHDVVDVDHRRGTVDPTFRPNQILAVGGLPFQLVDAVRARQIVAAVEARLWTRLGLRSLAPTEPGYIGRYGGGVPERDGAYHQGTVWPWLAGPFIEAWVRVRGDTPDTRREARARFLEPLLRHHAAASLGGHIAELADAGAPHAPGGAPFQAWSVGEALRLDALLGETEARADARGDAARRRPDDTAVGEMR
jgi:glycogen debranching enzyme